MVYSFLGAVRERGEVFAQLVGSFKHLKPVTGFMVGWFSHLLAFLKRGAVSLMKANMVGWSGNTCGYVGSLPFVPFAVLF